MPRSMPLDGEPGPDPKRPKGPEENGGSSSGGDTSPYPPSSRPPQQHPSQMYGGYGPSGYGGPGMPPYGQYGNHPPPPPHGGMYSGPGMYGGPPTRGGHPNSPDRGRSHHYGGSGYGRHGPPPPNGKKGEKDGHPPYGGPSNGWGGHPPPPHHSGGHPQQWQQGPPPSYGHHPPPPGYGGHHGMPPQGGSSRSMYGGPYGGGHPHGPPPPSARGPPEAAAVSSSNPPPSGSGSQQQPPASSSSHCPSSVIGGRSDSKSPVRGGRPRPDSTTPSSSNFATLTRPGASPVDGQYCMESSSLQGGRTSVTHEGDEGSSVSGSTRDKARGNYRCGRCGAPKKGHICPYQPKLKRRPDEPLPEMRNAAVQVEMDEFMTLRRLNIRIQGFPESYATEPFMGASMVGAEAHPAPPPHEAHSDILLADAATDMMPLEDLPGNDTSSSSPSSKSSPPPPPSTTAGEDLPPNHLEKSTGVTEEELDAEEKKEAT